MPYTISKPKPPAPQKSSHKWITYVIEGVILLLGLALAITLRLAVFETAIVISGSMRPTMEINDRVLIDHRASLRGKWQRGDVLLFDPPEAWGGTESLTKRLIGLPGETVTLDGNTVSINNKPITEPYTKAAHPYFRQTFQLGSDEYFVLGDNRDNSEDSRDLGPISGEDIRGRAIYRIYPLGRFGKLPHPEYPL